MVALPWPLARLPGSPLAAHRRLSIAATPQESEEKKEKLKLEKGSGGGRKEGTAWKDASNDKREEAAKALTTPRDASLGSWGKQQRERTRKANQDSTLCEFCAAPARL